MTLQRGLYYKNQKQTGTRPENSLRRQKKKTKKNLFCALNVAGLQTVFWHVHNKPVLITTSVINWFYFCYS